MTLRIAYATTARSDYGPCYWLIHDLLSNSQFEIQLVVGGAHLSKRHGYTVQEIESDGWPIAARIPFLGEEEDDRSLGRAAGTALQAFSDYIANHQPDLIILYGDRYELLPLATAAVLTRTPIAHLCGGDITEGAIDDQVRHALTKMSHIHFPSTERSARRLIQMGEEPWRVHNVGDPALDQFVRGDHATLEELTARLGFIPNRETLIVTFHPVTLEIDQMSNQARELSAALRLHCGPIVITAPAPDPGSDILRLEMDALVRSRPQTVFIESLGRRHYKGLLRYVGAMVGNSSSGLNEAPCVPLPVVNIGSRQKGRDRARNVVDVPPTRDAIAAGIATALSNEFRESLGNIENPYGRGDAGQQILKVLSELPSRDRLLKKQFVDLS